MTRRWQLIAVLLACLAGTAIGTFALAIWSHTGSNVSASNHTSPPQIALMPSSSGNRDAATNASTDASILQYQSAVQRNPNDAQSLSNLSFAYMQKERESADVTYYGLTDEAASKALRIDPKNYNALVAKGWVALGRHDFALAATIAQRALKLHGENAADYANLGDAQANLGNYKEMVYAYQRMVNIKPGLSSYNRASYVRWLYGDVRGAVRFMLLAIRAGSSQPENVAWVESQLGDDYFNAGFLLGAQSEYRLALKTFPHYARALAGQAAVEAALGHPKSAISYYQQAIAVIPLPQYLIGLGDLYASLGKSSEAAKQYAVIRVIDHIFDVNKVRYGIDKAQFDADHNQNLPEALRLAQTEAATRHDIQTMDILAWALYKNGKYREAWTAEKKALSLHTHYALYFFHAGMIQSKLGNIVEGQSYLQSALMLNSNFHPLYAPQARAELLRLNRVASHPTTTGSKP